MLKMFTFLVTFPEQLIVSAIVFSLFNISLQSTIPVFTKRFPTALVLYSSLLHVFTGTFLFIILMCPRLINCFSSIYSKICLVMSSSVIPVLFYRFVFVSPLSVNSSSFLYINYTNSSLFVFYTSYVFITSKTHTPCKR